MGLSQKLNRSEKHYAVGLSKSCKQYVLQIVTGLTIRYYKITKEEYMLFKTDKAALDKIAVNCHRAARMSPRFMCSSKKEENTVAQMEVLRKLMEE